MNEKQRRKRGQVAPFNLDPRWPAGYLQLLEELGVTERRGPFYASWVRQFFTHQQEGKRWRDLGRREIEAFIQTLAAQASVADWQIAQARDALEVYYEQFRGITLEPVQAMGSSTAREPAERIRAPRLLEQPPAVAKSQRPGSAAKAELGALENAARDALRTEHYALKTEKADLHWIGRFIGYHRCKRPSEMGAAEIHQFLSHLALKERVAASTQNLALNAIVFLYHKVVKKKVGEFSDFPRARRPKRLPIVLSRQQVQAVLSRVNGAEGLLARLLYGRGMWVSEVLRLRVQDLALTSWAAKRPNI